MLYSPCELPTIFENDETEEVWSPDVETALMEGIRIYPPCGRKKIKHNDGQKYGRNCLLALYIKKKCGKIRSSKQIASHLQFLEKKMYSKIPNLVPTNKPLIPKILKDQNIVEYRDTGEIIYLDTTKLDEIFDNFSESSILVQNLQNLLALRKISSSKLALIGFFAQYENLEDMYNNIFTGITCASEAKLTNVKYSKLAHRFDEDFAKLFNTVPLDSFYLVKSWGNLNIPTSSTSPSYIWKQIFYSPYKMDMEMSVNCYVYGKLIYKHLVADLAMEEVLVGKSQFYIYHVEYPPTSFGQLFVTKLHDIKVAYGRKALEKTLEGYTLSLVLRDKMTREVLLVIPVLFDYDPYFSGYRLYHIKM